MVPPPYLQVYLWPRATLTFGLQTQKLIVSCHCHMNRSCQLASTSLHSFAKCRVRKFGNGRTDGRTSWDHRACRHAASLAWRMHHVDETSLLSLLQWRTWRTGRSRGSTIGVSWSVTCVNTGFTGTRREPSTETQVLPPDSTAARS